MELNPEQPTDFDACKAAARDVLRSGTMHLVAVHFPEGAFAYTRDGNFYSHPSVAIPETAIIGTNGAGDAFAAGFLYALHENMGIETAIITGHAAVSDVQQFLQNISACDVQNYSLYTRLFFGFSKALFFLEKLYLDQQLKPLELVVFHLHLRLKDQLLKQEFLDQDVLNR